MHFENVYFSLHFRIVKRFPKKCIDTNKKNSKVSNFIMGVCFSRNPRSSKGAEYDSAGNLISCIFCTIAQSSRELLFEDETCSVFFPLDTCAKVHVLIVPKIHVKSICNNRIDIQPELLRHLKRIGDQVLDRLSSENSDRKFMFHLEPYNSIEHLHMHGLVRPFNLLGKIKFSDLVEKWGASYENIMQRIEKEGK